MSTNRLTDMADIFHQIANRIERENAMGAQALREAVDNYVPAKNCPWCAGQQEFAFYSGGDVRYETCDFCSGLGKVVRNGYS